MGKNRLLNHCYVRFGKNKHCSCSGTSWPSEETITKGRGGNGYVELIAGCISIISQWRVSGEMRDRRRDR